MTTTPDPLDLDAIEARANEARRDIATKFTDGWPRVYAEDVPALVAEVRRLRHALYGETRRWEMCDEDYRELNAQRDAVLAELDKVDAKPGPDGERKINTGIVRAALGVTD